MRTSLFFLVLIASVALVVGTTPNTPPDGSSNTEGECLLDGLEFTNGLKLIGDFKPNVFHYQCTCEDFFAQDPYTTVVKPHLMDPGSTAEITFNGVQINFRTSNQGISNGGNDGVAPNSPLTQSSPLTFVTGENRIMIGVGCNGRGQPVPCYYQYNITCTKPPSPFVVGDPQFTGLRGQNYQVHGVAGEIYNIVSDSSLQYNSRFVFLEQGKCPVVNGKKQKGCWSHPGSYLGELGLKTKSGERIHITSGDANTGFALIEVNGKSVEVGDTVLLNEGSVSLNSTHVATVNVANWSFTFENSDMFINQRVKVLDARKLRSHGLLGQTWRETTYPNAIKYIQGQVDDYVIRDQDIFGDNFVFNTFN